jgi:hypothetical protein
MYRLNALDPANLSQEKKEGQLPLITFKTLQHEYSIHSSRVVHVADINQQHSFQIRRGKLNLLAYAPPRSGNSNGYFLDSCS